MEISGLVSRQIPHFTGAWIDPISSKNLFSGKAHFPARNKLPASFRSRRVDVNYGFYDNGHVEYYFSGPTCGIKEKEIKKKLKLLKGLAELSSASMIISGSDPVEGSVALAQGKLISERAEALILELEEVRGEEKEMKRKKKEENKAERMKMMKVGCGSCESSSSSSSSESSDSECEEVIDMKKVRGEVPAQGGVELLTQPSLVATLEEDKCGNGTSTSSCSNGSIVVNNVTSRSEVMEASVVARVEVCMGKKCKASGGVELMEEFERLMGAQGSVVGCKCMGKCKNGANVRVLNSVDRIESGEGTEDSVRNPTNPLYIGVGLEDVSLIVANLMGEVENDAGAATAT